MKKYATLLLTCLLFTSCMTSKYARKLQSIQIGMTPSQVIAIMGEPHQTSAKDGCVYYIYHSLVLDAIWCHDEYHYVRFINDRVDSYGKQGDFDSTKDNRIKVSIDNTTTTKTITEEQPKGDETWNKLQQLKKMRDRDLITEEEFQSKKKEILDAM